MYPLPKCHLQLNCECQYLVVPITDWKNTLERIAVFLICPFIRNELFKYVNVPEEDRRPSIHNEFLLDAADMQLVINELDKDLLQDRRECDTREEVVKRKCAKQIERDTLMAELHKWRRNIADMDDDDTGGEEDNMSDDSGHGIDKYSGKNKYVDLDVVFKNY